MKDQPDIPRDQSELLTVPKAGKDEDRPVNRLLKIHEAAQLELQDLEADFQIPHLEYILQPEVQLKQRVAPEHESLGFEQARIRPGGRLQGAGRGG